MKKIFIICCLLFFIPSIKAINVEVQYIDNIYSNRPIGDKILSGQLGYIYADKNFAYCLDPSLLIITGENNYHEDQTYLTKTYTPADIDYINQIAYYGYEYENHQNQFYYMAAQELIWEHTSTKDFYFTDQIFPNGNVIDTTKYKQEIIDLINTKPFNNQTFNATTNEELIITDETNTLKNYDIIKNDNFEIRKEANQLFIKPLKSGDFLIILEQNIKNNKNLLVYSAPNHQTIGSIGTNIKKQSEFTINVKDKMIEQKPIIEDILPKTNNPNHRKNISSMLFLWIGLYCLKRK
ncbi:MAG: thioester domain-containing protein [Bacilli bacterium]